MPRSGKRFAEALRRAIDTIAFKENKKKQSIHDELGFELGRDGGSAVAYWLYHEQIPARLSDVEELARAVALRNGWDSREHLLQFLEGAEHPEAQVLSRRIFPPGNGHTPPLLEERSDFTPFIVGPPIHTPRQFFGRERELRRIFAALKGTALQNVAIIGPQRSGKTSLLHYVKNISNTTPAQLRPGQFSHWLLQAQLYHWVFVDFQDPRVRTQAGLLRYILGRLNYPVPADCTLNAFIDTICHYMTGPVVVLMDEVQVALNNPELDQSFWWGLRSLSTNLTEGRLGFILASQRPPTELAIESGRPSPFLNIFGHMLMLGPLTPEEARMLVASSPSPFVEEEVDWILAQSRCWPALLQILCQTRWLALEDGRDGDNWKQEALHNIEPYRHLLAPV